MRAVGLRRYLPIDDTESLLDVELPTPEASPRDLLVRVHAVAVNPVDTKVRAPREGEEDPPRVLGWDAAGEVVALGTEVEGFAVGDRVFYAGDITRAGCNAQLQVVDARIVGQVPDAMEYAQAASLPLTSITAWEGLFDRLGISADGRDAGKSLLILGGAGGVGSIAIQLARKLAHLTVVASASRPESRTWVQRMGATHVIDHRKPLAAQLAALGLPQVDYVFCLNDTDGHWDGMCEVIAPQGRICSIVETRGPVSLGALKSKSATFVWEFMFTRSMFQTEDMAAQGRLLNAVAACVVDGTLVPTLAQCLTPIDASNLRRAHATLEAGHTVGKIVLRGWPDG